MGVSDLVSLYDAMYEIEKLKDDIMEMSAILKQMQNEELNNIIKKIDEQISAGYWFAAASTERMKVYYIYASPAEKRSMREHFHTTKTLLKNDPEKYSNFLEEKIRKLETYIEVNKNAIGERYIAEIRNYITLLRKFDASHARFVAELIKSLDHAISLDPTKSDPIKGFDHKHKMYN
ncbi:MAG: hypothetical protein QXE05_05570 [Nitrososphaeria archaeon]